MQAVAIHGTKWADMVKLLPGRTDNAIKNRWNSMQRKEDRRLKRLREYTMGSDPNLHPAHSLGQLAQKQRLLRLEDTSQSEILPSRQIIGIAPQPLPPHSSLAQQCQVGPGGGHDTVVKAPDDMNAASLMLGLTDNSSVSYSPHSIQTTTRTMDHHREMASRTLSKDKKQAIEAAQHSLQCAMAVAASFGAHPITARSVTAQPRTRSSSFSLPIQETAPQVLRTGPRRQVDKENADECGESPRPSHRASSPDPQRALALSLSSPRRRMLTPSLLSQAGRTDSWMEGLEAAKAMQALCAGAPESTRTMT